MFHKLKVVIITTLFVLCMFNVSFSQTNISITGTVVDSANSQPIANAVVRLIEFSSLTTTTNGSGAFTLVGDATNVKSFKSISVSPNEIILNGNKLIITGASGSKTARIDVFESNGSRIYHAEQSINSLGNAQFLNLWKTPGLYYVKIKIGNKEYGAMSIGTNHVSLLRSVAGMDALAKTNATYTLHVVASGYAAKNISMSSTTGDAGTIRLFSGVGIWAPALNWSKDTHPISGEGLLADPVRPGDFYFFYQDETATNTQQHVAKSTDFGVTWTIIDTTKVIGNAWGNAIDPNPHRNPNTPPTMYAPAGFSNNGLWKSVDGGVTWRDLFAGHHDGVMPKTGGGTVTFPSDKVGGHVDFYQACILPDNPPNHILVTYHYGASGQPVPVGESKDGGLSWEIHLIPWGGSHYIYGVDSTTWILISGEGANAGTYQTTTAGRVNGVISPNAWKHVDDMEHVHGAFTPWYDSVGNYVYFPTKSGIRRSHDGGATWTSVYSSGYSSSLVATGKYIYSTMLYMTPMVRASISTPTVWTAFPNPPAPEWGGGVGPYSAASAFDGKHWIVLMATYYQTTNNQLPVRYNGEIWRYVEP